MQMPVLNGFGLITQARASGYTGAFVVLSAFFISPDDRQRLAELGVARVLEKPSRPMLIVEAVHNALAGS